MDTILMSRRQMATVDEFSERLSAGHPLIAAGDERLLRRLPRGNWIGGTGANFIADEGGLHSRDRLFLSEVVDFGAGAAIKVYDARSIASVYADAPANGYSFIVIPAASSTLQTFALGGPRFEGFASRPLIGWVAGVDLADVGRASPKVFDGRTGRFFDDAAVVMHVALPKTKTAEVGIINLFEPGDGDVLTFPNDGFTAKEVIVDGKRRPFVAYLKERRLDTRLPLVADYNGAVVNTSFQSVDEASGEVRFYAPVFRDVRYRHARPVGDYVKAFTSQLTEGIETGVVYACNCILNYVHAGLEGRRTPGFTGPATFGEIAYQLLNQTLVYVRIVDINLAERLRGETVLRKHVQALETAARGLEVFSSMVSHDLRVPLRHMLQYSTLLESSPAAAADAQTRDYAHKISSAAEKMTALLDGLASLARADRAPLSRAPVDLGALVAEVIEDLRPECAGRAVVWNVPPLPVVRCDRILLKQVLVNLLSNAVKFTRDRAEARVDISARKERSETLVTVRDNGAGFDPRKSGRLFEPFQRLESAEGFAGSGLSIAARVVTRHGGRIWADGRPGEGASFSFSLPDP